MAERRMFAKTIIDSDAFLDMPMSSQCLYFHLAMRADDDGFVNNPRKIIRMLGASEDDMKVLIAKKFILGFESGVIVVKHWRIHNYIRKDRYNETVYKEEKALLSIKSDNGYTLNGGGQPLVNHRLTQDRTGQDRIGQDSIDNCSSYADRSDIWQELSEEAIDELYETYENAGDLIQAVYEEVRDKRKKITDAFAYIVGYANNRDWPRVKR